MIKVLAIDDDLDFHPILKAQLPASEFSLTMALSSEEFFQFFNSDEQRFDLLILDLAIGESSLKGLEILSFVREKSKHPDISIIVLTSNDNRKIISSALEMGANDFLAKPIVGNYIATKAKALILGDQIFTKKLNDGDKNLKVKLATKFGLKSISEIGLTLEGSAFFAKGTKIQVSSPRIGEIFGDNVLDVYSTGFSIKEGDVYLTTFEIDPDEKDLINKAKMWIKLKKS